MKVLITGVCGFVGASVAKWLRKAYPEAAMEIHGIDNLSRAGAATNLDSLRAGGIRFRHVDVRVASDLLALPRCDWVIDAAAHASVLAGTAGQVSSQQLIDTNLGGTVHLLECCRIWNAGLILLSSSRVYSLETLCRLPLRVKDDAYRLDECAELPGHVSSAGVTECFSNASPVSLYGASKLASELLAIEYSHAFQFPVLVNRCGILAGSGQFGRADQGIYAYWLHSWRSKQKLRMIGFDGQGHQVRDCLHPDDLARLIQLQLQVTGRVATPTINVSGGAASAMSIRQLCHYCRERWGHHDVESVSLTRPFDVPWLVLDSQLASSLWEWRPTRTVGSILDEIAEFADAHPEWLAMSNA